MKKLNITKEQFNRSSYFQRKYGKLEYVSENGKLFKTDKGKVLKFNEGIFWPTPEEERTPIFTIELSREDDDEAYVETPMKYSKIYLSEDEAFEDAEKLADEYANDDGKYEVHVMAGEYQIGDGEDIYGDPFVAGSIQTGRGWKMVKEGFVSNMGKVLKFDESEKKLVKEGAGAGYTVEIKDLKFGKILSKKLVPDKYYGYYECQVEILPGEYEIAAEDYYNDFFWQEHEWGDTPTAKIDGGVATVVYSKQWEDDEQSEEDLRNEVENQELDITFSYGHGWMHIDLPREGIEADHVDIEGRDAYFGIDKLVLNAPDLADAVNCGFQSTFDQGDEDDEEDEDGEEDEGEPMNESYDDKWQTVAAGYDEFVQRLWGFTRKDMKNRRDAFSRCTNAMEKALKDYYNEVVYDGAD